MKTSVGLCLVLAFLNGCAATNETSNPPRKFSGFENQSISVIINYAVRGGTDLQARAILRHLKNHIPGNPRIKIRNLSGRGGVVGANFLGESGQNNGYMMGIFTPPLWSQVMKNPALRTDFRDFEIVGSIAGQSITHIRTGAIPGSLKSYKDLLRTTHVIRTAGHGRTSKKDIRLRLYFDLLKIPYRHTTGYKSAGRIRKAIQNNKVDFTSESFLGYFYRTKPNLVDTGHSIPAWHIGRMGLDGSMNCTSVFQTEIPCFMTVYEEKFGKGKRPPDLYWQALRTIAGTDELQRLIVFPKGTPGEVIGIMRTAWAKTMNDPAYLEEFRRMNGSPLVGMEGADAQEFMARLLPISQELQKFLLDYAAGSGN